jgi:hypothetical protein
MFMKRYLLALVLVLLAVGTVHGQSIVGTAWNGGAVVIVVVLSEDEYSVGQGYIAYSPDYPTGLRVYTIYHVIEGGITSFVTIPTLVQNSEVVMSRYNCEVRLFDGDTACWFDLVPQTAELILSGQTHVLPYVRMSDHPLLHVEGHFIGSPRPDTGLWTVYQPVSYSDYELNIHGEIEDGFGTKHVIGNFCRGRSGGPAVLVTLTGNVELVYDEATGFPISLGELERGDGPAHSDIVGTGNVCYQDLVVNRVSAS